MLHFLKFFFSLLVAMLWHYLGGSMEVALFFFISLIVILFFTPIKFQSPKAREEYMEKLRRARERKRELEEARLEEKRKLKEGGAEKDERLRQEYESIKKKSLV
ncbi:MAG: hypothetical protein ACTTJS_02555 [Wolinella sp.]